MKDSFGRSLTYFRISVTDRCNLRCRYCMPEEGIEAIPHEEILRYGEIERVARIMAGEGASRLRLTGGEPLVRRNLPALAARLKALPGIGYLGLTTNGLLLAPQAAELCRAGVDGINLSLDTLDRERFAAITRRDALPKVWEGLQAALGQPFKNIKINCVLAPSSLKADWMGVVALAKEYPLDVRLIEWMPMAGEAPQNDVGIDTAKTAIEAVYGPLSPLEGDAGAGPALYFGAKGFTGRLGFIPAMSHQFCGGCNRLRLTASGHLKLCLFYGRGLPLKPLLRGGASDAEIAAAIRQAVQNKPEKHSGQVVSAQEDPFAEAFDRPCGMYRIGG